MARWMFWAIVGRIWIKFFIVLQGVVHKGRSIFGRGEGVGLSLCNNCLCVNVIYERPPKFQMLPIVSSKSYKI